MIADLVHLHTALRSWNVFNWAIWKKAPQRDLYLDPLMKYEEFAPPIALPDLRTGKYQVLEVRDTYIAIEGYRGMARARAAAALELPPQPSLTATPPRAVSYTHLTLPTILLV